MFLIVIPLVLSAFTHLWNPIGFPGIFVDEGYYMGRAMHVLEGKGPQEESYFYDHPYFGQLFLAGVFTLIDYPSSLNPTPNSNAVHSIEMLYTVPRVLMGLLAVIDTFLVYNIAQRLHNRKVAFIASILFAVMPITWSLRWILLDTISLPLLLSSILFAVYYYNTKNQSLKGDNEKNTIQIILLSGTFLGLAIFTKIPAFTMIPLVGFLIYRKNNNNNNDNQNSKTLLAIWFIPVILIPLIWPIYSAAVSHFNKWSEGILRQINREKNHPLFDSIRYSIEIDPVLSILGIAGLVFGVVIKRNFLLLFWVIPLLVFLYLIGYVSIYHLIPLLPVFCIAAAKMINDVLCIISKKIGSIQKMLQFAIISAIAIFGFISTAMWISMNVNSAYFETVAFVARYVYDNNNNIVHTTNNNNNNNNIEITMIADPSYSWIPKHVFHLDGDYKTYYDIIPANAKKVLLIVDRFFIDALSSSNESSKQIKKIYESKSTNMIVTFGNVDEYNQISIYQHESKPGIKTN